VSAAYELLLEIQSSESIQTLADERLEGTGLAYERGQVRRARRDPARPPAVPEELVAFAPTALPGRASRASPRSCVRGEGLRRSVMLTARLERDGFNPIFPIVSLVNTSARPSCNLLHPVEIAAPDTLKIQRLRKSSRGPPKEVVD
jgi:hypothetical protein